MPEVFLRGRDDEIMLSTAVIYLLPLWKLMILVHFQDPVTSKR